MKNFFVLLFVTSSLFSIAQSSINDQIDLILEEQIDSKISPGLTVGVVKDGQLIYHNSRGMMNMEYNLPFNDSTIFSIASITKQFTSACIAVLEKRKEISVNDDVRKYIPELNFYGDTIRIKHLLNHTSGIRNHNVLQDLAGFDYDHQGYTNEMIQQLMFRQQGINNLPGEKMLYSNTNYVLLALVIERISGIKIHEFAKKELFDPLGMSNSFYRSELNDIIKNRAYSYYKEQDEYKQPKSLTLCVGAGGMGSTISDLVTWSQIFLDSNHSYSYVADFITKLEPLNNGTEMQHARGMFVTPYKGHYSLNHSGRGFGMRSQFICFPDLDISVIVFSNSESINAVNVSYEILDLWIDELVEEENTEKPDSKETPNLANFIGDYQELNSDLRMKFFIDHDTLHVLSSFGSQALKLSHVSGKKFARLNNSSVKYSFISDDNSGTDLLIDFGGAIFYFERVKLAMEPNKNISDYIGTYFSQELDVTYELLVSDEKLILNYPFNMDIILKEGEKDVFGANRRTKYTFTRDSKNKVVSFHVASEGTVKDILFVKE